jgi:hypothetical protein
MRRKPCLRVGQPFSACDARSKRALERSAQFRSPSMKAKMTGRDDNNDTAFGARLFG